MRRKRIVSVLMSLVLLGSVLLPSAVHAEGDVTSDSNVLYSDGFEDADFDASWNASGNAQVSAGTMNGVDGKSFYAYLSNVDGASSWTDYTVEADMTITAVDSSNKAVTGIAVRSAASSWYGGYIMKISYADQKVYLYSGKSDGSTGLITLTSETLEVGLNQTYHLKLSTVGDEIIGYVGEDIVLEYTAP